MADIKISYAAARVNARLSQTEAAIRLKITRNTLQNWEAGKTQPKASQLHDMSEVYGIPESNLIFLPMATK